MFFKLKRLVYLASRKKEKKQLNFILYYVVKKYALSVLSIFLTDLICLLKRQSTVFNTIVLN